MWFKLWVKDNYTIKQLSRVSGHSIKKLQRIVLRELNRKPPDSDLAGLSHVVMDGKFLFGRRFCLVIILDAITHKPVAGTVIKAESKKHLLPWLWQLKEQGFNPKCVTTDGNQSIITAFREAWPGIITQRCLFHIRLQVSSWARVRPRYKSTRELSSLVETLTKITTKAQAGQFYRQFLVLSDRHAEELKRFSATHPVEGDAIRAYSLVDNALDCCFCYLDDPKISPTTSALEGYIKQIQRIKGFDHNGLTQEHLFSFIAWKIHYDRG